MGCASCATGGCSTDGKVAGCGSKTGSCSCNRLNTYDWLSDIDLPSVDAFDVVEVSFKDGSRKGFYHNPAGTRAATGDMVVVESGNSFDVGRITLSGELVKLQLKKKKVKPKTIFPRVIRRANERDLERLAEARAAEPETMVKARVIARQLGLDMKVGDVEYQGDKRKATFYYTADGRVDFRELIKQYAREFRVKIEMRQIGARQESARIGGLGSCGRELCCSTWLSDFKSVSTAAARYQNLAINQAKLSGQCGRLKCCLNFELDTYMDALEGFPDRADRLETEAGTAVLIKTDIFKRTMYYIYKKEGFGKTYALSVERVKEIQALNRKGQKPLELQSSAVGVLDDAPSVDYGDVTGGVEWSDLDKHAKKKKRRTKKRRPDGGESRPAPAKDAPVATEPAPKPAPRPDALPSDGAEAASKGGGQPRSRSSRGRSPRQRGSGGPRGGNRQPRPGRSNRPPAGGGDEGSGTPDSPKGKE